MTNSIQRALVGSYYKVAAKLTNGFKAKNVMPNLNAQLNSLKFNNINEGLPNKDGLICYKQDPAALTFPQFKNIEIKEWKPDILDGTQNNLDGLYCFPMEIMNEEELRIYLGYFKDIDPRAGRDELVRIMKNRHSDYQDYFTGCSPCLNVGTDPILKKTYKGFIDEAMRLITDRGSEKENIKKIAVRGPGSGPESDVFLALERLENAGKLKFLEEVHVFDCCKEVFENLDRNLDNWIETHGPLQAKIFGYKRNAATLPAELSGKIDLFLSFWSLTSDFVGYYLIFMGAQSMARVLKNGGVGVVFSYSDESYFYESIKELETVNETTYVKKHGF